MTGRSAIRRLATAATISVLGSEAAFVVLGVDIYRRTQSTVWLAAMMLLTFGITGIIQPFAGAIGDRFDRKRVMIISDLLGAVAFVALGLIQLPSAILLVAFIAALVEAPFRPAAAASVANIVDEGDLAWANSLIGIANSIGRLVGPAVGGLLAGLMGAEAVYWLNAGSFVVSVLLIAGLHARFSKGTEPKERVWGPLAGFRQLKSDRLLSGIAIFWGLSFFAVDLVLVANLPLAKSFHAESFGYSLFFTAFAGGGILGYALARKLKPSLERIALVVGSVGIGVGYSITAVSPAFALALFGVALAALVDGIGTVAGYSIVQRRTPDEVRARVFASLSAIGWTANSIAFLTAGVLLGAIGPRWVYAIGAATGLVGTAVLVTYLRPLGQLPDQGVEATAAELRTAPDAAT